MAVVVLPKVNYSSSSVFSVGVTVKRYSQNTWVFLRISLNFVDFCRYFLSVLI